MRFWLEAFAEPNRIAAQVLTSSPMKVRTLGLMRERASQRTMVSSRTPQARPKALVQEALIGRTRDVEWNVSSAFAERVSFAPPGLLNLLKVPHGLRRGLHSFAAS